MSEELRPEDKEKFILEARHLEMLVQSQGWRIIEDEVKVRMSRLVKALIACDEDNSIHNLQANIRSLEFLLRFPNEMLETAKRVTEAEAPND